MDSAATVLAAFLVGLSMNYNANFDELKSIAKKALGGTKLEVPEC